MAKAARDTLLPVIKGRLDRILRKLVEHRGVRHALVAVGRTDGSPLWVGTAGAADEAGRPITADTPFFLASVTKLYIATATLRLVEQGRVSLDAPIAEYLPVELVAGLHVRNGVDRTTEITIRHLLGHATGFPEYLVIRPPGGRSLFDSVAAGQDGKWSVKDIAALVREHGRPEFPPRPFDGRRHTVRYSDTNFQLLIAIIRAVTDTPLQNAFDDLIFKRLGLKQTFLPGSTAAVTASPAPAAVWRWGINGWTR